MSLEDEIKALTIAVNLLTETLKSSSPSEAPAPKAEKAPVKKAGRPKKKEEPKEEGDGPDEAEVRELAKQVINDGADRKAIKELIVSLGGDKIGDLDGPALATLFDKLKGLCE